MNIDINLVATISIGVYGGWLLIAVTRAIFSHGNKAAAPGGTHPPITAEFWESKDGKSILNKEPNPETK